MSQPLTTHSLLHLYLHLLIYLPITHSHLHLFFHPSILSSISQSFTTHYIFIHPFILSPISQSFTHYTFIHLIILWSSTAYYIFIHQQITNLPTSSSVLPSSHPSANHGSTFISLSIPPSSHPAANASCIHYMFIHPSILSFISKLLTTTTSSNYPSIFNHQPDTHPLITSSLIIPSFYSLNH